MVKQAEWCMCDFCIKNDTCSQEASDKHNCSVSSLEGKQWCLCDLCVKYNTCPFPYKYAACANFDCSKFSLEKEQEQPKKLITLCDSCKRKEYCNKIDHDGGRNDCKGYTTTSLEQEELETKMFISRICKKMGRASSVYFDELD